jgi:hypothetical protein
VSGAGGRDVPEHVGEHSRTVRVAILGRMSSSSAA